MNITLEKMIDFLLGIGMFEPLSVEELSEVLTIIDIQPYREGQEVFSEGDVGDAWYVVYSGAVSVRTHKPFQMDRSVAVLEKGCIFGEMAILDEGARSATVIAQEESLLFRFPRTRFERLLEQSKIGAYKLVYGMACVLVERQREVNQILAEYKEHEAQQIDDFPPDDYTAECDEE
ncbi:MAG: cyclic nucleotide-binding domain-containing protein [Myxococcota bacterium]|nr:cyclic nucleotide-binding domain-containing protein [Myxococcota bacterium]